MNFKQILMVCVTLVMIMGLVNAFDNIGTYKRNTNLDLNLGCSYNNTYCDNTFSCNITIYNQRGILINNKYMSNTSYPQYNYTILANNLSINGLYYGRQVCCGSVGCADYSLEFTINAQGKEYGTIQGSVYAILLVILLLAFGFSLWGSIKIPYKNFTTPEGKLFKINWQKYLKIFLFGIAYTTFIGISYFAWNISLGILEYDEMAGFFNFLYTTAYMLIFPILATLLIVGISTYMSDRKYEKLLARGLTIR